MAVNEPPHKKRRRHQALNKVTPGQRVAVRDARGFLMEKRAWSDIESGSDHDFPIVWVSWLDETADDALPWPCEDVFPRYGLKERVLTQAEVLEFVSGAVSR